MGALVRVLLCVAVLSGSLNATPSVSNNQSAIPRSARILFTTTPLDPQRKLSMPVADEGSSNTRGRVKDRRILKYLSDMIRIARRLNRREMKFYYEHGYEFAADRIYGAFPPRPNYDTGQKPSDVVSPLPAGLVHPGASKCPLRKIVKKFSLPCNTWTLNYETLECAHVVLVPSGWSAKVKSRRCLRCYADKMAAKAAKKKPAGSAAEVKAKAVSA